MFEFLLGFRKLFMAVVFLLVAVLLLIFKIIPANDWLQHVSAVMISFQATNIAEHLINVGKEFIKNKSGINLTKEDANKFFNALTKKEDK